LPHFRKTLFRNDFKKLEIAFAGDLRHPDSRCANVVKPQAYT